jgi:uncharacterized protein YbjT (DUF2867 family)
MRVIVTGAYGLIGSAVLARLHRDGHELVGTGRQIDTAQRQFPYARWVAADFRDLQTKEAWKTVLTGIDAVVNCAGAFQQSLRDDLAAVHVSAPLALFAACEDLAIKRVVQISAIGAGLHGASAFAKTKGPADTALAASTLPWIILRPGVVLAPGVYGASAMLRGLAGLPWRTPLIAGDREVRIVSVEDVADTVACALGPGLSVKGTFELLLAIIPVGRRCFDAASMAWIFTPADVRAAGRHRPCDHRRSGCTRVSRVAQPRALNGLCRACGRDARRSDQLD